MRSAVLDHALSHADKHRQADTLHEGPNPHVGPWWAWLCPPVGAAFAPASVSPHYAGKIRVTPGKDALHAKDFQRLPRVNTSRARMCSSVVCPSQYAI